MSTNVIWVNEGIAISEGLTMVLIGVRLKVAPRLNQLSATLKRGHNCHCNNLIVRSREKKILICTYKKILLLHSKFIKLEVLCLLPW